MPTAPAVAVEEVAQVRGATQYSVEDHSARRPLLDPTQLPPLGCFSKQPDIFFRGGAQPRGSRFCGKAKVVTMNRPAGAKIGKNEKC